MTLGLLSLLLGFIILMFSTGLGPWEQFSSRIAGVTLLSLGTVLALFGSVWCLCSARTKSDIDRPIEEPDLDPESQTLTEAELEYLTPDN